MVFPSNAHPGKVVEGGGREGDGRNGGSKSSDRPIRERGAGGLSQGGGIGKGKSGITSTRRSWWREGLACEAPLTLVTDPSRQRQDGSGGAKRRAASGSGETAATAAPCACAKCTHRRREWLGHGPIWAGSARLG
uniref:Uncharacterized protein n=1 Tax=Oryza nivara TaxID=4536 RepID=A0A0E0J9T4_ORYNI